MNTHCSGRSYQRIGLLVLAFVGVAWANVARAQHGDVWLSTDVANNKIAVGVVDETGITYTPGVNVLEVILTSDALPFSPFDYSAEDPGFRSAAGELPASQAVGLSLQSLTIWSGAGLDPAAGVAFSFDLTSGFVTEADGSLHGHPLFGLTDLTLDPLPLPDGVYVASFTASMAGLADSDAYYFVMLKDDLIADEDDVEALEGLLEDFENGGPQPIFAGKNFAFFEEAVEFVEAAVPEPHGAALACCGGLGLLQARRRERG
jgi:hypothetical protein